MVNGASPGPAPAAQAREQLPVVEMFVEWIRRLQTAGETGVCGNPLDLKLSEKIRRESRSFQVRLVERRVHKEFC